MHITGWGRWGENSRGINWPTICYQVLMGEGCSGVCSRDRETAPRGQHPAGRWPWGALQARPLGAAPQQSPHSVGTRTISVKNIPLLS